MKSTILNLEHPTNIPGDICPDNILNLLLEGYLFIPNRIRKYHCELFHTRLLCKKVICMSGKKAAELFYDQHLFTRRNVIPKRIQETLFGKQAIQTLTGAAHAHRKLLFLSIMSPENVNRLAELTKKQWQSRMKRLDGKKQIILFDEAARLLFEAACNWAGVPVEKSEMKERSKDMSAMVDAFGAVGPRHIIGRLARNRSECWAQQIIQNVRSGKIIAPTDSALFMIAWHKDLNNQYLNTQIAAVELINILRPITAIATYVTFGALAINTYPNIKEELQKNDSDYLTMFVQEIRRFYPFAPFLGAKVRVNFKWKDYYFKKGTPVLLDIYGTNHDPAIWKNSNEFQPEHFRDRVDNPFDFIPQGGGDYKATRCPGEMVTIELLKVSMGFLANHLDYEVPLQDLGYRLCRIPAIPKSKFIISNIKTK